MPNLRLNKQEALDLIAYIDEESQRVREKNKRAPEKLENKGSVTAALTVSHAKPAGDVVAIMNPWVREAHLGAKMNAGYMTLVNVGSEEATLVKVESEAFDEIEIHEMAMVDGLMSMREITNLVIPANGQTRLKPGGMHLMLMGPRQNMTAGQKVDMTLTFKSERKQTVPVGVFATEGNAKDFLSSDVVAIMNAWIREAHLGAKMNAGYMTLINVGSEEVTLVKVESEAFKKIEIHEMAMVDGLMSMRELN